MSFLRRIPIVALVALIACAHHAERIGQRATRAVKAELAQIDPAVARDLGDQAARGAVNGVLTELGSEQHRALLDALAATTSGAAARGVMRALIPERAGMQQLVDRTMASAVAGLGKSLADDTALRGELAGISRQLSAAAVAGARDALSDVFPDCARAPDRRRCVEDRVSAVSRAAARGMLLGFVDAAEVPLLVCVFLAGVLVTLLVVRVRRPRAPSAPSPA
jgi:hypothetical protein